MKCFLFLKCRAKYSQNEMPNMWKCSGGELFGGFSGFPISDALHPCFGGPLNWVKLNNNLIRVPRILLFIPLRNSFRISAQSLKTKDFCGRNFCGLCVGYLWVVN